MRPGVAVVTDEGSVSWASLRDRVERLAAVIDERVRPGGHVAVAGANTPETLVSYLACLVSGRAPVGINPKLARDEFAYLIDDAGIELLLGGAGVAQTVDSLDTRHGFTGLYWGGDAAESSWQAAIEAAQPNGTRPAAAPVAPLLYTSGTSGRPKGTRVRWVADPGQTVAEHIEQLASAGRMLPEGPHQVAGPLYHNGPLIAVRALLAGRTIVLPSRFDARGFLRLVQENGSASSVMVPTHLSRLLALESAERESFDTSSLQKVILTGAACPADVKRAVIRWWGPVVEEVYGGTESGTLCRISATEWLDHPGSVGRTVPGFQAVVVDRDGTPQDPGTTGRLYFRDASLRGIQYHNAPDKTAQAHLEPGTFTLGDVGYLDADGYVHITDRDVDMVVSGGVNIYPAEVERVLSQCPAVTDVAVIGVPNTDMGEELRALVSVSGPVTEADLDTFCRQQLAGYKCPRSYQFVDRLPRNDMGKLNKRQLRQTFWPDTRTIGG
ncbi:AMP-binding protein [Dietzia lutea]|nr:AMP-binding protein [Dietzia lutea]